MEKLRILAVDDNMVPVSVRLNFFILRRLI